MTIKQQTSKDLIWKDEIETPVPYKRITASEKIKEKHAYTLAKGALALNKSITDYKTTIALLCDQVVSSVMTEKEQKKITKGNFTWYNFDGSIKIEVAINENIEFDGLLIEKAKQKLYDMIGEGITEKAEFLKELIMSAFENSGGKLDTKKVLGLKKHAARITDKRFHEAMTFIDQSIRRPTSKTYFRVWIKNDEGQYESIDMNFSSIKI